MANQETPKIVQKKLSFHGSKRERSSDDENNDSDVNIKKTKKTTSVAIIGTAGRKGDANKMNQEVWKKMIDKAQDIIENEFKLNWSEVELVSGGAAFADHVAVALFLKQECKLKLELPAAWESDKAQFKDDGTVAFRFNPGGTSNYYHRNFSKKCDLDSLKEIELCKQKGATFIVSNGFKVRNSQISKSDMVIAFSFSENGPNTGGTKHTWDSFKPGTIKKHVCITKL